MPGLHIQRGNGGISIGDPIRLGTPGSVLYIDSSGDIAQDNTNFFWNESTLGLDITGEISAESFAATSEQVPGNIRTGYMAVYNGGLSGSIYKIGACYSHDGVAWVRDARNPILSPSGSGWEGGTIVKDPYLVMHNNILYLYYSGFTAANANAQTGVAISKDYGRTFVKYSGNPVIANGSGAEHDNKRAWFPVVKYDETETNPTKVWKMWYAGRGSDNADDAVGYAYSADGLSWTKFGQVLSLGTSGDFDDNLIQTGGDVLNIDGTYYWFYAGNHSVGGRTQWRGGLITFADPEGTYTRQGEVLSPLTTHVQDLTVNAAAGDTSVTVTDSSVFTVGEFVYVGSTSGQPFLTRVDALPDGTTVTLRDALPAAHTTATSAAIRSVYSWSLEPRSVFRENGRWTMVVTAFQSFSNVGGKLTEIGVWAYNTNDLPTGAWTLDIQRGVILELEPYADQNFEVVSAENHCVIPLRFSPALMKAEEISGNEARVSFKRRLMPTGLTTFTGTGLVTTTSASTTVTGFGTRFTKQITTGDIITVNSTTGIISTVESDTSLTLVDVFGANNTKLTYTIAPIAFGVLTSGSSPKLIVDNSGHVIIGSAGVLTAPQPLHVKIDQNTTTNLYVENSSTGTSALTQMLLQNHDNYFVGVRQYGSGNSGTLSTISQAGLAAISTGASTTALLINASQNTTPIYNAIGGVVMTTLNATGLGIGAAVTPTHLVDVSKTWTTLADNDAMAVFQSTVTLPGSSSGDLIGFEGVVSLDQNSFNATDITNTVRGVQGAATIFGASGTVTNAAGVQAQVQNSGAGTLTNGYAVYANLRNAGGGVFTNAHGLYVPAPSGGTNVVNYYGVRIVAATTATNIFALTSSIAAASNRWNLYIDGTAQNYIAGKLGLGITTPTNDLSFGGTAARTIWMERNTTSNTAGNQLQVQAGGATSGATNKAGGQLALSGGISTGSGLSNVSFFVYGIVAAATSDNTQIRTQIAQAWSESGTDRASTLIDGMLQFNNQVVAYTTDVTVGTTARIYGTNSTGSSYPFQGAGHLVIQARPDASRDIVFVTGTTPTTRMIITGGGNVGLGNVSAASQMLHITAGNIYLQGTSPAFTSAVSLQFGGNRTSPVAGNITFGDGTGWKLFIAKGTDDAATQWVTFQDNGRVGIGITATTPSHLLHVINTSAANIMAGNFTSTFTDPASSIIVLKGDANVTLGANNALQHIGVQGFARIVGAGFDLTNSTAGLVSGYFQSTVTSGAGTVTGSIGAYGASINASTGTMTTGYGVYVSTQNTSSGTLTTGIGLFVNTAVNSGGGTFGTNTGIHIAAQTVGSTAIYGIRSLIASSSGRWNLFLDGTAQNHLRGNVGIGTGSQTPAEALYVSAGKLVLDNAGYATSKFNSQGVDWATFGAAPSFIFNGSATDRPEISWIRGSRTYPEFSIRQHTSADTGGQIWVGGGTVAPSATVSFNSKGIGIFVASANQRLDIQSGGLRFSPLASAGALTGVLAGLGAGNLTNGIYAYGVSFVNAHGESARGTGTNVTVVDATTNGQIALSAIPTSSDPTVTARNIYRSASGQSGFWLLTTLSDNTTTTYTDNISDATLKTGALGVPHQGTASGAVYTNTVAAEKKVITFDGSGLRTTFNPGRVTTFLTDQTLVSVTPATRGHGVFVYNNGYLYSIVGSGGTNVYYSTVGSLGRPEATSWTTDSVFPVARSNACGVATGGYIYVIGGTTANSTTSFTTGTATVYFGRPNPDGTVSSWQTTTALPAAVSAARCVVYNGYLYVVGGANTSSQAQTSVYYAKLNPDGTVGAWSTSANTIPVALIYHGLAVLNGYMYVYGGRTNDAGTGLATDSDDAQTATYFSLMNTSTGDVGAWSTSAQALPVANAFLGSYSHNGNIVAAGGINAAGAATSVNYYARPQDCGISDTAGEIGAWTASATNTGTSGLIAAAIAGNYIYYLVSGVNVRLMTPVGVRIAGDLDLLAETYRSHTFAGAPSTTSGGGSIQCLNVTTIGDINTLGTLHVQGLSYFADAVGIRSSSTNILMVDGQAAHTISMSRNFTSNTAGNNLTIQSGGATSAATNKSAGNLILSSGISTGSGTGSVIIQVSPGIAASTTDNTLATALTVGGDKSTLFTGKSHQFNSNTDGDFQATGVGTTSASGTPIRHCSAFLNGYLYRMGGDDAVNCTAVIQYAQIAVDGTIASWTTEATNPLPAARSTAASCTANGYIYHLGGKSTTNQTTATATVYYNKPNPDGSLGTWGTTTALPSVLTGHKAIYYNGYIYVAAGANSPGTIQSAVYYAKVNADGTVGTWFTANNALGTAVNSPEMAVANGVLYVFGGSTTGSATTGITTVQYSVIGSDNSPGTWSNSANSLNTATTGAGGVIANGYLYSIAGIGTSGSSISTVQYTALAASGDVGVWTTSTFTNGGNGSCEAFALNGLLLCVVNNNVAVRIVQLNRLQAATTIDLLGLTSSYLTRTGEASSLFAGDIYSSSNLVVLGYSQFEGPAQFSSTIGLTGRTTPAKSSGNGNEGGTTLSVLAATGGIASSTSNVTAGLGGIITFTAGTGGAATGASGANIGGAGGTIELIGGTGGAVTSGTAGIGGNVHITGGTSTVTAGNVILGRTAAGVNQGFVGIGLIAPAYLLDVGQTTNGAIRANQYFVAANNLSAFNATEPFSLIYGTGSGGGAYPFLTSGNLVLQSRPSGANRDIIFVTGISQSIRMVIDGTNSNGNIGLNGVTVPTNALSFGGTAARTIWMERHTTADTAGNFLNVIASGATSGATNKAGGDLVLSGGISTGSGTSKVRFRIYPGSAAATSDNSATDMIMVSAAGLELQGGLVTAFNTTLVYPVIYPTTNAGASYPFLTAGNLVLQSRPSGANRDIVFVTGTSQNISMVIDGTNNRVGVGGVTAPTNIISLDGQAARTIWMERNTTSNTAGNSLTIQGGGATSAATNKNGGNLLLAPGLSTGTGEGNVQIQVPNHVASGTGDSALIDKAIYGNKALLTNDNSTLTTLVTCTLATDSAVAGIVRYSVEVVDGSHNVQLEAGEFIYTVTNTNGTRGNNTITFPTGYPKNVTTSGTLVLTFAISTAASPLITLKCNSSLTASTGYPRISYSIENLTNQAIA